MVQCSIYKQNCAVLFYELVEMGKYCIFIFVAAIVQNAAFAVLL